MSCNGGVFITTDKNGIEIAVKVFKKDKGRYTSDIKKICEYEALALQKANSIPELRCFVPEYFGLVKVERIEDIIGNDISDEYHLDIAYSMQALKHEHGKRYHGDISKVCNLFIKNGIFGVTDYDVIIQEGRLKLIDISLS